MTHTKNPKSKNKKPKKKQIHFQITKKKTYLYTNISLYEIILKNINRHISVEIFHHAFRKCKDILNFVFQVDQRTHGEAISSNEIIH